MQLHHEGPLQKEARPALQGAGDRAGGVPCRGRELAEQARAEILPYFKKHNYDYKAGNGTWCISKPAADDADYYRPELHVEDDDLPENIRAVLYLETEYNQPLGYFIADIKRGEW